MARISYSQLSMFNECPQRWKLNYVDKLSISESNIYLVFGTAMHEVIQTYLDIMYNNSVKNAEKLDLNKMLFDNMCEEFKKANEQDGKAPCTKEEISEFFQDGVEILDFVKSKRNQYFQKRDYELIGCEVPIDLKSNAGIESPQGKLTVEGQAVIDTPYEGKSSSQGAASNTVVKWFPGEKKE